MGTIHPFPTFPSRGRKGRRPPGARARANLVRKGPNYGHTRGIASQIGLNCIFVAGRGVDGKKRHSG